MQNEIKKVARIQLYDESYDKAVPDTGIVFYNLDINTAVIEMEIVRKNYPLQISDENVDTYVYLQGVDQNGNDYGEELDVEYIDPFGGLLSVTIPSDYLKAVNGSTVLAQLYITLHKNNRVPNTKSDTVVLNEFKFTVKDALINSISGVTKIEKIREFDKMRDEIRKRMTDIETAMKNGSDYVIRMENALIDGLKQINDIVAKAKKDINDTVTSAQTVLNTTKENAVKSINDTTSKNITDSNKAKQDILDAISNAKLVNEDTYETNNTNLNKSIIDGDTKSLSNAKAYVDAKAWQKYKLTNDTGLLNTIVTNIDMTSMTDVIFNSTGFYYCSNLVNVPDSRSKFGFINVYIQGAGSGYAIYREYNSYTFYLNYMYGSKWYGWNVINPKPNFTDTGWLPLTLTNNVQAYSTAYVPQYKLVNNNGDITLKLKGAVKNLTTTGVTIATLPSNIASLVTMIAPFVQNSSFKNGNATIARWSVNTNGEIKLDGVSFSNTMMTADDFYPITTVIPL